jgi:hypothetical protein
MTRGDQRLRIWPGPIIVAFALPAMVLLGIGIFHLPDLLNDPEVVGVRRVLAGAVTTVATVGVPVWLVTMHISIQLTDERLRVRLWPLWGTTVPLAGIRSVDTVAVEPLGEYGGVGLKGTRTDRLLGFVGDEAARIGYVTDDNDERRLTLLTPHADGLVAAIRQRLPKEHA